MTGAAPVNVVRGSLNWGLSCKGVATSPREAKEKTHIRGSHSNRDEWYPLACCTSMALVHLLSAVRRRDVPLLQGTN